MRVAYLYRHTQGLCGVPESPQGADCEAHPDAAGVYAGRLHDAVRGCLSPIRFPSLVR